MLARLKNSDQILKFHPILLNAKSRNAVDFNCNQLVHMALAKIWSKFNTEGVLYNH